jgi:dTDP-4-amino-4,6-dideoxygalactose transaminase
MYRMGQEEVQAVQRVITEKKLWRYFNESEANNLEQELGELVKSQHVLVTSSGTAALISGLTVLGIGQGDEVIVPAYTFVATAFAVLATGAIPILAEVDESLTLDINDVKNKITTRSKAIIPVHINGLPCHMDAIVEIAQTHKLFIVEDACQAVGGSYKGQRLGTIGHIGAFSFNYFKIISAGEGGALLTKEDLYYERAKIYHDAGCAFFSPEQKVQVPYYAGVNYRMSEILSAILREQAKRLDGILIDLRIRKRLLSDYIEKNSALTLAPINDIEGDCSVKLGILFDNYEETQRAMRIIRENNLSMKSECPYESDRHIYMNWDAILNKRGALNELNNPYRNNSIRYTKDMCPKTLINLQRTLYLVINPDQPIEEVSHIAKQLCELL